MAKLAKFFAEARAAHLPLVVHLRGGGSFLKAEVETFIEKVLSQAGDLPVQIAPQRAGARPPCIAARRLSGDRVRRRIVDAFAARARLI